MTSRLALVRRNLKIYRIAFFNLAALSGIAVELAAGIREVRGRNLAYNEEA